MSVCVCVMLKFDAWPAKQAKPNKQGIIGASTVKSPEGFGPTTFGVVVLPTGNWSRKQIPKHEETVARESQKWRQSRC